MIFKANLGILESMRTMPKRFCHKFLWFAAISLIHPLVVLHATEPLPPAHQRLAQLLRAPGEHGLEGCLFLGHLALASEQHRRVLFLVTVILTLFEQAGEAELDALLDRALTASSADAVCRMPAASIGNAPRPSAARPTDPSAHPSFHVSWVARASRTASSANGWAVV